MTDEKWWIQRRQLHYRGEGVIGMIQNWLSSESQWNKCSQARTQSYPVRGASEEVRKTRQERQKVRRQGCRAECFHTKTHCMQLARRQSRRVEEKLLSFVNGVKVLSSHIFGYLAVYPRAARTYTAGKTKAIMALVPTRCMYTPLSLNISTICICVYWMRTAHSIRGQSGQNMSYSRGSWRGFCYWHTGVSTAVINSVSL